MSARRLRPAPRLIAITELAVASMRETVRRFEQVARAARPFSVMFQLRDRELAARERLAFGRSLRELASRERQWFQVNDRCDLALLLNADALHLGEASVTTADARRLVGTDTWISRACHEPERELEQGIDAWVLSPIFEARKGRAALGVAALTHVCERLRTAAPQAEATPGIFGLGGVTAGNVQHCLDAGASGVAAIGALLRGDDSAALVAALGIARG